MADRVFRQPWRLFLQNLDALLHGSTELHCLGGFVIVESYDFTRVTADLDVVDVRGIDREKLADLAGRGSELHRRHKIHLDIVTVASVPENYEERLRDLLPGEFKNLRLKAFEPHDLVLSKLARNLDRDREDVKRLAAKPSLDPSLLKERYHTELRHQLARPEREDLTLVLWLEMIHEVQQSRPTKPKAL